jgi:uncharacterized lipoprotein
MTKLKWIVTVMSVVVLSACLSAGQEVRGTEPQAAPAVIAKAGETTGPHLQARDQRYRIWAGDSFDISFDLSP